MVEDNVFGTVKECYFIINSKALIKDKNFDYSNIFFYPWNDEKTKGVVQDILFNDRFIKIGEKINIQYDTGKYQYEHIDIQYKELTIDCKGNRYRNKYGYNKCFFEMFKTDNSDYSYGMGSDVQLHVIACFWDNRILLVPASMVELIANRKADWLGLPKNFYTNTNLYKENLDVTKGVDFRTGKVIISKNKRGVSINMDVLIKLIPVFLDKYYGKFQPILKKYISDETVLCFTSNDDSSFNGDDDKATLYRLLESMFSCGTIELYHNGEKINSAKEYYERIVNDKI